MKFAGIIVIAALLAAGPALADWQEYTYPEMGFAISFPVAPTVELGSYESVSGKTDAMIYSTTQDNIIYTLIVADFAKGHESQIVDEALAAIRMQGEAKADVTERVNGNLGHELTIANTDGSRSVFAVFFVYNRLYRLEAKSLPPDALSGSGETARFQLSLRFVGAGRGFLGIR